MSHHAICQKNAGKCPVCGKIPNWFNDVPLRAFCFGTDKKPHPEASRVLSGEAQPYGKVKKQPWKVEKELTPR